jgi:hypothetical protein
VLRCAPAFSAGALLFSARRLLENSMNRRLVVSVQIAGLIAGLIAAAEIASAQQPARPADVAEKVAELEAAVARLQASDSTNSQAIAEITTRLAEISQEISRLAAPGDSRADLVRRVDELGLKINGLERELETLRTQLANLEQPEVTPSSGTYYDDGFVLVDGDYSLHLFGFAQSAWSISMPREFDTVNTNTFDLVSARLGVRGRLGSVLGRKLRYRVDTDLQLGLFDAYLDVEIIPQVIIRTGQSRILHTRAFTVDERRLSFPTRTNAIEIYRYDREPGVWAHGRALDRKLWYYAGFSNGGSRNGVNDNIDLTAMARVEYTILGEPPPRQFGDVAGSEEPSLTVGASAVHDLVRVPELVAGLPVGNRDVDNDLVFDNVRVVSAAADALFRLEGIEVLVEGLLRQERWGTILLHSDNQDVADQVRAGDDGVVTYYGLVGHVTYFALPERLMVGGRVGYSEQPLLGLGGRQRDVIPVGDRLFELDTVAAYYHNGEPLLSVMYTLTNFNNSVGPEAAFDVEHRFLIQTQLGF